MKRIPQYHYLEDAAEHLTHELNKKHTLGTLFSLAEQGLLAIGFKREISIQDKFYPPKITPPPYLFLDCYDLKKLSPYGENLEACNSTTAYSDEGTVNTLNYSRTTGDAAIFNEYESLVPSDLYMKEVTRNALLITKKEMERYLSEVKPSEDLSEHNHLKTHIEKETIQPLKKYISNQPEKFEGEHIFKAKTLYGLQNNLDSSILEKALFEIEYPFYINTLTRPAHSQAAKEHLNKMVEGAKKLRIELKNLSIDDLQEMVHKELDPIDWWSPYKSDANYNFWLKMDIWQPKDAALLLSGLEPKQLSLDDILKYSKWVDKAQKVNELWEILRASISIGSINASTSPAEYITWALDKGFNLPNKLSKPTTRAPNNNRKRSTNPILLNVIQAANSTIPTLGRPIFQGSNAS
jgi:hypothetical protein